MGLEVKKIAVALRPRNALGFIPVFCVGVLLVETFRLYKGGAYFSLDDFNNLYWVQRATFAQMAGHIIYPVSAYFRPAGMTCYWVLLQLFGLNSAPYHWLAWSLHTANTTLLYFALKKLTKSRAGGAVGAMLFASQAVFADIYWDFGTIFEVVAAFFSFIGILLWTSERRGWSRVVLASLALLLAMKGKEMAITMPFIWIGYDLLLRKDLERRLAIHWALPCGLALWYGLTRAVMRGMRPSDPYYMSFSALTFVRSLGVYFNMLFGTSFQWQVWCSELVVLLLVFVLLRSRLAIFFQFYVLVTFLPVIFLINHRYAFYWYLPFLGVSGLIAMLAKDVAGVIENRNPEWLSRAGAYSVLALLSWGTFLAHKEANRPKRSSIRARAAECRAFVTGLKALTPPPRGEVIYFDSKPSNFGEADLLSATQVVLRRTDLGVKLVSEFPPETRYRLRFEESRLRQLPQ